MKLKQIVVKRNTARNFEYFIRLLKYESKHDV